MKFVTAFLVLSCILGFMAPGAKAEDGQAANEFLGMWVGPYPKGGTMTLRLGLQGVLSMSFSRSRNNYDGHWTLDGNTIAATYGKRGSPLKATVVEMEMAVTMLDGTTVLLKKTE